MTGPIREFSDHARRLAGAFRHDGVRPAVAAAQLAWADLFGSAGATWPGGPPGTTEFIDGLQGLVSLLELHARDFPDLRPAVERLQWYRLLAIALRSRGSQEAANLIETTRHELTEGRPLADILDVLRRVLGPLALPPESCPAPVVVQSGD